MLIKAFQLLAFVFVAIVLIVGVPILSFFGGFVVGIRNIPEAWKRIVVGRKIKTTPVRFNQKQIFSGRGGKPGVES